MGRVQAAKKNIMFGTAGKIATVVLPFILRTLFIVDMDKYLGINSLYTEVLSFLNMAELGIGTAINFSLYGPVARGEKEKVKSYMQLYKKAYYYIALVVTVIGLALVPFLGWIVKQPEGMQIAQRDLVLFYLIFLFNTVSSYFVAYKYSLANAEQKSYIQENAYNGTKIISVIFQIIVVVLTKSFYMFLITDAIIQLIQKVIISRYLDNKYPLLKEKNVERLSKDEEDTIWTKTKALVLHRVGDVFRLQTDALIISKIIGTDNVGYVNNYTMVVMAVSGVVDTLFNSITTSFGNLIATESKEKQYSMFKIYRFVASWIYGFAGVGFMLLLSPLIEIWTKGAKGVKWDPIWLLTPIAVFLYITDFYFKGERKVLVNFKTAAGVFEQDKYLALIQGVVNLILSIWLAIAWRDIPTISGIAGVYVGTVVSGLIANITKPIIIYRTCFDKSAWSYFLDSFKYLASLIAVMAACYAIQRRVMPVASIPGFIVMVVVITVLFNGVYLLLYGRTEEFKYLVGKIKNRKA
ncbi:lipopolysaccharide biosynthesis protein [Butyrivibrio sp. INlla21]|uniref:lipopolysaccharide biosynthesis protein n=1 Tax=Butyrivibrio sp. INlla21 TaxID=1520811 RepID=UPI0008E888A0|nr:polysaccharide biosynthesis protein [Butyrivibrio sp. INlla21]SFU66709.1 Membrane protein involved in the export of O-antigen and teichoic acid [Butyrivibrio sp. INlla21]